MKYEELKKQIETLEWASRNTDDPYRALDLISEISRLKNIEIKQL